MNKKSIYIVVGVLMLAGAGFYGAVGKVVAYTVDQSSRSAIEVEVKTEEKTEADVNATVETKESVGGEGSEDQRGKATPKLFESAKGANVEVEVGASENARTFMVPHILEVSSAKDVVDGGLRGVAIDEEGDSLDKRSAGEGADYNSSRSNKSRVRVNGDEVRGWSAETKAAVLETLAKNDRINDANDFGLHVAAAAVADANIKEVLADESKVELRYKARARFLGFFPVDLVANAQTNTEGGVKVRFPWYGFLFSKESSERYIALALELKAKHEVAMNSVRNMK
jgi:hypothetical protein